jgi:hypothetical protein
MTTARRGTPIPQLKCLDGCGEFTPQTVQCKNAGSDGVDVQWKCESDMPKEHQFGKIEVSCEGYSYPEDAYILAGSCGLEFSIELTTYGKRQHRNNRYGEGGYRGHNLYNSDNDYESHPGWASPRSNSNGSTWFMILVVGVIAYFVYKSCVRYDNRNGGGGGGWWSGPGDYPGGRPFSAGNYQQPNNADPYKTYSNGNNAYQQPQQQYPGQTSNNSSGFWTGALTGSALGYLFGSRGNNQAHGYGNQYGIPRRTMPFGGQSFTTGQSSGGSHNSAGFGGTRRR